MGLSAVVERVRLSVRTWAEPGADAIMRKKRGSAKPWANPWKRECEAAGRAVLTTPIASMAKSTVPKYRGNTEMGAKASLWLRGGMSENT